MVKQELPAIAKSLTVTTPRTSCNYFLPKIHKPHNLGRPIVSDCSCPTQLISSYLDKIMAPIVKTLPSHIKDSQHALEILVTLISLAKTNLFSLWILHFFILSFPMTKVSGPSNIFSIDELEPSSETLLRLAELVLTLNCFSFGGNYYKQTNGVALGTKMGSSYANIFVNFIEHQLF